MSDNDNAKILKDLRAFFKINGLFAIASDENEEINLFAPLGFSELTASGDLKHNSDLLSSREILALSPKKREQYFKKIRNQTILAAVNEPITNEIKWYFWIDLKMNALLQEFLRKINQEQMNLKNLSQLKLDFTVVTKYKKAFEKYLKGFKKQLKKYHQKKALKILDSFNVIYNGYKNLFVELKIYFRKNHLKKFVIYNSYSIYLLYHFTAIKIEEFYKTNFLDSSLKEIFDKTDKNFAPFYLQMTLMKTLKSDNYEALKYSSKNLLKTLALINQFCERMVNNLKRLDYQKLINNLNKSFKEFYFLYLLHLQVYQDRRIISEEKIYDFLKIDLWNNGL
ncbi:hypothetical protein SSABA_v1c05360 [Spiroplasma sabaudiense Ar-1343]|uniref:Uncharacterized protein n=1 Tax=Spiroplasma sabaudiense Ar-1343 TaxID=1276257 RepID=W6A9U0_9MOLU|nr:hypothetical protein [Spiroplasma sabaudiense]AHI53943.1 hypothetical protein SSABA_v1c05360 [Spiroplasma sabaudiense Ar-1343]